MLVQSSELDSSYVLPPSLSRVPSLHSSAASYRSGRTITQQDLEFILLGDEYNLGNETDNDQHGIITAPIFSREAYEAAGAGLQLAQYGVLGSLQSTVTGSRVYIPDDKRLYLNTNAPFSAVVCGVQGSGKSHSVSVLLENMFIGNCPHIGSLKKPLSGLVLHFGEGGPGTSPCEAAWLAVAAREGIDTPTVRVHVPKSSLNTMRRVYEPLGDSVTVEPLFFDESELDAEAFLTMMAVTNPEVTPLYMQVILSILRDLGENFTFSAFENELYYRRASFNPMQKMALDQRLSLLMGFMLREENRTHPVPKRFKPGELTIIDLSDPFVDPASACGIFEIVLRIFQREQIDTGKVVVVDEAHKYLSANRPTGLTNTILEMIRQQRHQAMRVIISTQEPTVIPSAVLDLCSVIMMHRFSSPAWWEHLIFHVSADLQTSGAFEKLVNLQTGQAIVLAPSGLGMAKHLEHEVGDNQHVVQHLGRSYLFVKTRKRVTKDGGSSVLVI